MVDRDESRRGGTGRGTGLRAGCSPRSVSARFLGVVPRPGPASLKREPKSLLAAGLQPHRPGDALCHPLPLTRRKQRPTGRPWRERPPSRTRLAVPSPFRRVAHAPAACLGFLVKAARHRAGLAPARSRACSPPILVRAVLNCGGLMHSQPAGISRSFL